MNIKNNAKPTLKPDVIIGSIFSSNETGPTNIPNNPPQSNIKIHMEKMKL